MLNYPVTHTFQFGVYPAGGHGICKTTEHFRQNNDENEDDIIKFTFYYIALGRTTVEGHGHHTATARTVKQQNHNRTSRGGQENYYYLIASCKHEKNSPPLRTWFLACSWFPSLLSLHCRWNKRFHRCVVVGVSFSTLRYRRDPFEV